MSKYKLVILMRLNAILPVILIGFLTTCGAGKTKKLNKLSFKKKIKYLIKILSLISCLQFNSGKNKYLPIKQTKLGGRNYGLGLFIGPLKSLNKYPTYHSSGLRIFVHNNSFLSSSADEVLVEFGKHSSIKISKIFTHKTPAPHSSCQVCQYI